MGVGIINLWVPDVYKNNCAVDNSHGFVATVQHCDGTVLEWKGGKYQTKDGAWHQILGDPHGSKPGTPGYYDGVPGTGDPGHLTFQVPPGCYVVSASTHIWIRPTPAGRQILLGNLATHKAVVCVRCDEEKCVTLFQPSGFHCSTIMTLELLLPVMEATQLITKAELANAEKAMRPIMAKLAPSAFDQKEADIAKTIVKRLTRKSPRKEK